MYERTSDAQHEAVCNVLQYSDPSPSFTSLLQSGSSTSTAPLSPPRTHVTHVQLWLHFLHMHVQTYTITNNNFQYNTD